MKKIILIFVIITLILGAWLFYNKSIFYPFNKDKSKIIQCSLGGGKWVELPDSCVDNCREYRIKDKLQKEKERNNNTNSCISCANQKDSYYCLLTLTWGCDCGPDQCWNVDHCEKN